uniref:Uncharacterized protein n=1 Tax=Spumella elongata TaxID=89044 RepID=A0A7S3M5Z4_9STRA|mmetsp:Transcript_3294/g.5480  ORF Transcript_3294/g.5480 Transcript_3294/m.5480 type:complete len:145 (+) Transcript_3294:93-527(+)|eukprot:CAMPEP_0184998166 /NCGR_PEP_ID=MMETSP1098-20130426/61560_1 /TAXON_ID=89044 /ORGANISM="Spumella elongata, Strain CCAP 955/1" /LENGTH=144 /DNA_ID=CAMNT_0027524921 /DNA_START=93 /DNA_END=527 /DNA_ORIENTATION=+
MKHLIQLEVTDFFCSAEQFADPEYLIDKIWRHSLFMYKVKAFKLMFHFAKDQEQLDDDRLPVGWHYFGDNLPNCHVMNQGIFKAIMRERNLSIADLQRNCYMTLSTHEIELFDQSNAEEYLKSLFTLNEFVKAACVSPLMGDGL